MDELRRQYLERMGIPVWISRPQPAAEDAGHTSLALGPGNGSSLFLCESREAAAGRLAADLARIPARPPVWAWPVAEGAEDGLTLAAAVNDRLFTAVVVFGEDLGRRLLGGPPPEMLGPARVLVVESLEQLAASPVARRDCWRAMVSGGIPARP